MSVNPGISNQPGIGIPGKPLDTAQIDKIERNLRGIDAAVAAGNLKIVLRLGEELRRRVEAFPREGLERGILQTLTNILTTFGAEANAVDLCLRIITLFQPIVNLTSLVKKQDIPLALLLRPEGISAVIQAGVQHAGSVSIQLQISRILCRLASTPDGARILVDRSAPSMIIRRLAQFAQSSQEITFFYSSTLATLCMMFTSPRLLFMKQTESHLHVGKNEDPAITNIMSLLSAGIRNPKCLEIQANICCCLSTVATDKEGCASIVAVPEAVRYAFSILKLSQTSTKDTQEPKPVTKSKFATLGASAISALSSGATSILPRRASASSSSSIPQGTPPDVLKFQEAFEKGTNLGAPTPESDVMQVEQQQANGWDCSACTFHNEASEAPVCEMCLTPRHEYNAPTKPKSTSNDLLTGLDGDDKHISTSILQPTEFPGSNKLRLAQDHLHEQAPSDTVCQEVAHNSDGQRITDLAAENETSSGIPSSGIDGQAVASESVLGNGRTLTSEQGPASEPSNVSPNFGTGLSTKDTAQHPKHAFAQPKETFRSLGEDLYKCQTWASVLIHNMCFFASDIRARKYLFEEFSTTCKHALQVIAGNLPALDWSHELVRIIHERLKKLAEGSTEHYNDKAATLNHPQDPSPSVPTRLVDALLKNRNDGCTKGLLFHFNFVTKHYGVTLQELIDEVMHRVEVALGPSTTESLPGPLPFSKDYAPLFDTLFVCLSHPALRRNMSPAAVERLVPAPSNQSSISSLLRRCIIPETVRVHELFFDLLLGSDDQHTDHAALKDMPFLPYRSTAVDTVGLKAKEAPGSSPTGAGSIHTVSYSSVVLTPFAQALGSFNQIAQAAVPQFAVEQNPGGPLSDGPESPGELTTETLRGDSAGHASFMHDDVSALTVAMQISLRLQQLYAAVDPCALVSYCWMYLERGGALGTRDVDPLVDSQGVKGLSNVCRFLSECKNVVAYFQLQILHRDTPLERSQVISKLIDIGYLASRQELSNLALAMCCVEALEAPGIRRLELTWRNVGLAKWQSYLELKRQCGVTAGTGERAGVDVASPPVSMKVHSSLEVEESAHLLMPQTRVTYLPVVLDMLLRQLAALVAECRDDCEGGGSPRANGMRKSSSLATLKLSRGRGDSQVLLPKAPPTLSRHISLEPSKEVRDPEDSTLPEDVSRWKPGEVESTVLFLAEFHGTMAKWVPTVGGEAGGDWYPRMYRFNPLPRMQLELKNLPRPKTDRALLEVSQAKEPAWSLRQMFLESLYAVEAVVEELFSSPKADEGAQLSAFTALVAKHGFKPSPAGDSAAGSPLSAEKLGGVIGQLTGRVLSQRKERLLAQTGTRGSEHWDAVERHVRVCVERMVLGPVLSRVILANLGEHSGKECALQERLEVLRAMPTARLVDLLGVPVVRSSDEDPEVRVCEWKGAVVALRSIDCVEFPSLKVQKLLEVKDEIMLAAQNELGMTQMAADDFLPVMTFVLIHAEMKHPWSTFKLLRQLLGGEKYARGEAAYYLTTVEIALDHLVNFNLDSSSTNAITHS